MEKKPSLALIPSAYKEGKVYSVLPADGVGDFDFSRASNATRINKDGLIETVGSNIPRLNYPMIDGVVSGCPSLLLEPSATNVITNSNTFNANANVVVNTNNVISPDGTLNASKVTANSGTSLKLVDTNGASSGTYRFSVFAKKDTHNIIQLGGGGIVGHANFNLETGEYSSGGFMENYGNGWYRCSVQFSAGTPTSHYVSFSDSLSANRLSTSVSTGSFFLFGMQSETTSYTTSYIPSLTGSQTTRSAETCNGAGDANTFNDSEGVLFAEISALVNDDSVFKGISLNNGTVSNEVLLYTTNANNTIRAIVQSGGSIQFDNTYVVGSLKASNKVAIKYKSNDFAFWVNGVEVGVGVSGNAPIGLNTLAFDEGTGTEKYYGKVKDLRVYNTALTDAELIALTQV